MFVSHTPFTSPTYYIHANLVVVKTFSSIPQSRQTKKPLFHFKGKTDNSASTQHFNARNK